MGSIILDCGCSQNICGEYWLKSYIASLSEKDQRKIEEITDKRKTKFWFGGGEILSSIKKIKIPAEIADRKVSLINHVVWSGIPLLWSRLSMTKAGVVLDLPSDRAKILGKWVDLNVTSIGHYYLNILPQEKMLIQDCYLALPKNPEDHEKVILKLHRKFGHPRKEVLESLLKNDGEESEAHNKEEQNSLVEQTETEAFKNNKKPVKKN